MGICCRTASSMDWGGEDWSFLTSEKNNRKKSSRTVFDESKLNKEKLRMDDVSASSSSSDHDKGKIRIKMKITRTELEVLGGEIEKQDQKQRGKVLSAEEVLVRLMKAREHRRTDHRRPWSPQLESLPEVHRD